jgi:hypothetical protein
VDELLTMTRPDMRARGPELVPAIVISIIVAVLFVVAALAIRMPDTVSFTVANQSAWRAEVQIRSASGTGWTDVGGVGRDSDLTFLEVPDQGSSWVVRYSYAGVTEDVEVSRDELAANGWRLEVPDGLATELADRGVPETLDATTNQ